MTGFHSDADLFREPKGDRVTDAYHDFYPTPPGLIRRLLATVNFTVVADILEPSAGKGDICEALRAKLESPYSRHTASIDAIEIDANLQHILRGKGFNLVHDDFLTFQTSKQYGAIIANFPFSDGANHLQKALSLLEANGGTLACLVNAETVRNPYTNQRKAIVARLRELEATIDYLPGEFAHAERPTDVEVAMIHVQMTRSAKTSTLLDHLQRADAIAATDREHTEIVDTDPVRALVARFDLECRVGIRLIDEYSALTPLLLQSMPKPGAEDKYNRPILSLVVDGTNTGRPNDYVRSVRHKYWEALIGDGQFRRQFTSNILKELDGQLERLKGVDFTVFNIRQLESDLRGSLTSGVEDAILAMFDEFSRKYSYMETSGTNIHYYNGWKSNKAHKINKKIILPVNGFNRYGWGKLQLDTQYIRERIGDLVKAFNYLAGDAGMGEESVRRTIVDANDLTAFRNLDFHYFTATFYLKGTCHIVFKDQRLLDKLNIYGSQRRGWLPPSYGRRAYSDMAPEEQAVVDEFQGKDAYEVVMRDRDYFLAEPAVLTLGSTTSQEAA